MLYDLNQTLILYSDCVRVKKAS